MSPEVSKSFDHLETPTGFQVAHMQADYGIKWANALRNANNDEELRKLSRDSEITLRNPAVYSRGDFDLSGLPDSLAVRWSNLLKLSDGLAAVMDVDDNNWSKSDTGLSKVQHELISGRMNIAFKGTLADVIAESSLLFSESTAYVPGDTRYFYGNAYAMSKDFERVVQYQ